VKEFENKDLNVKFSVPESMSVREYLRYISATTSFSEDFEEYARYWEGAKQLIDEWECELIPDINKSIDEMHTLDQTNIVVWVGIQVKLHVNAIGNAEKN
jgi:hypothetical protein